VLPGGALNTHQQSICDNEGSQDEARLQAFFSAAVSGAAECVGGDPDSTSSAMQGLGHKLFEKLPPGLSIARCRQMQVMKCVRRVVHCR
jgi:hypothetical protein